MTGDQKYARVWELAFALVCTAGTIALAFFLNSARAATSELLYIGMGLLFAWVGKVMFRLYGGSALLKDSFTRIKAARKKFSTRHKSLLPLLDGIIDDRVKTIENAASGTIVYKTEIQREDLATRLFSHLGKISGLKKIQSLTWDYNSFYADQWISAIKQEEFIERNRLANDHGVMIERVFVFRRDNFDQEKKERYKVLKASSLPFSNTQMKMLFEEDFSGDAYFAELLRSPSSFLLFIDNNRCVKILSENRLRAPGHDCQFYAKLFPDSERATQIEQQLRFERLWNLPDRDNP